MEYIGFRASLVLFSWTSSQGNACVIQVIIEGFKSYREQIATEPFSSKINCVGNDASFTSIS